MDGDARRPHRWTKSVVWGAIELLLVPIHVPSHAHWILVVVDVVRRALFPLDSLSVACSAFRPSWSIATPYLVALVEYLREEAALCAASPKGFALDWCVAPWPTPVPCQANGDDCGVFVLEFARRLADADDLSVVDPRRMNDVRRRIARELLGARLEVGTGPVHSE